ncbi:MAG TPA: MoaD/ThiS family protein [Actinospica sp.]|nr:MoaD/ThiS family protein [Actinospica sp.]HWG22665.1 MoaD/ThiS family protein [Actinospica sp.]
MTATLRFWAAAREAAGAAEETVGAGTLAEALDEAVRRRGGEGGGGAELRRVLSRSSVLLDGVQVGRADPASVELSDGAVIEILPPFAGG